MTMLRTIKQLLAVFLVGGSLLCQVVQGGEQRLGNRWALILDVSEDPQASQELARTLRESFGFSQDRIFMLLHLDVTQGAISDRMFKLAQSIEPNDLLFVHLSPQIVQEDVRDFLFRSGVEPPSSRTPFPMREFFDWLDYLPTGAALITYPSCPPPVASQESSYQAYLFEELTYGKRRGPVEFLQVCDFAGEAFPRGSAPAQTQRLQALTEELVSLLNRQAALQEPINAEQLAEHLGRSLKGSTRTPSFPTISVRLRRVPSFLPSRFSFMPSPTKIDAFRERFMGAESWREREAALYALVRAASAQQVPQTEAISFLEQAAMDEQALLHLDQPSAQQGLGLRLLALEGLSVLAATEAARDALVRISHAATSPSVRRAAVSWISRLSDPREADRAAIRLALDDPDPSVQETAIRGAVLVQKAQAADAIADLLRTDSEERVIIAALQSLSAFGREKDRPPVRRLLGHKSPEVRREAALALGAMGSGARIIAELLERILDRLEDDRVRQAAGYSLGRVIPQAREERDKLVAGLIPAVQESPDSVRQAVAFCFGKLGGSTAERWLLRLLLHDNAESVRITAAEALGELRSLVAMEGLRRAAKDLSPGLRRAAAAALGKIGNDQSIEILFNMLDDEDPFVRSEARRAIDSLQRSDLRLFLEGLESPSARVRLEAVEKLAESGDTAAIDPLIGLLNDDVIEVRQAAIVGLSRYTNQALVEKVSRSLKSENFRTRQGAVEVLGRISSSQVIPALVDASEDPNTAVRIEAIRALGGRRETQAEAAVLQATTDRFSEVRAAAAESLGRLGSEEAVQRLVELTKDESREVRRAAIEALTRQDSIKQKKPPN